jgi:hypothetical protein
MKKMSFGKSSDSKSTPKKFAVGGRTPNRIGGRATQDPGIAALREEKIAKILALPQGPGYNRAKDAIINEYNPLISSANDAVSAAQKAAEGVLPRQQKVKPINRGDLRKQQASALINSTQAAKPPATTTAPAPSTGGGLFVSKPVVAPLPATGMAAAPIKPVITPLPVTGMKRGGAVKGQSKDGFSYSNSSSSTSKRGDGIAQRGKTKGRMV